MNFDASNWSDINREKVYFDAMPKIRVRDLWPATCDLSPVAGRNIPPIYLGKLLEILKELDIFEEKMII